MLENRNRRQFGQWLRAQGRRGIRLDDVLADFATSEPLSSAPESREGPSMHLVTSCRIEGASPVPTLRPQVSPLSDGSPAAVEGGRRILLLDWSSITG